MAQREVTDGEIIRLAWEAEDRFRLGSVCLARRKLPRGRVLTLSRYTIAHRRVWQLVVSHRSGDEVWDFTDGDATWRAAIGWDGKGEPLGFARYRRRE